MNAKWYVLLSDIIEAVPESIWSDPECDELLRLICDAQVEAAMDGAGEFDFNLSTTIKGGDEPGMCYVEPD